MSNVTSIEAKRVGSAASVLPLCIEAEQALLGTILLNSEVLGLVSSFLNPDHFSEELHRRIYAVALDLSKSAKPVSPMTLLTYLGDHDLGAGVTTKTYLARLLSDAGPPILSNGYAREIRDLAGRRELISIADSLSSRARDGAASLSCVEMATESLQNLQRLAELALDADTRRDAGVCATTIIDRAKAIMRGEKRDDGVSTGLPDLDRATGGGFQPGTLWIIGGRPRMGKTIMATGFAKKVANRGLKAMDEGLPGFGSQIFSLEVTEDQIIARILADLAYSPRHPVPFGDIMRGAIDETALRQLEEAQARLARLPLALDVASNLTVQEIAARVRSEKKRMAKRNIRLAVCFIDYLKFVRPSDRYRGNRVYEVGEISSGLKQLAKTENVCVVLLAQVNRAVDNRDRRDRAPGLADLRESGDLEADTDVVVFIDRESVRVKQSPEYKASDAETVARFIDLQNKADLIVAKTRTGSEGTIPIWIDASASTFASQVRGAPS